MMLRLGFLRLLRRLPALTGGLHGLALLGILVIVWGSVSYAYLESFMHHLSQESARVYETWAYAYLASLTLGVVLILADLAKSLGREIKRVRRADLIPLVPSALIAYVLSYKSYFRTFIASSILYGLLYSVITSIIVYRPDQVFSQTYFVTIPSAEVAACCGPPLLLPTLTVYLSEHLGLLIIPLTVVLLLAVSILVGINTTLALFAYRIRRVEARGLGGLGAVVGLFTGCPTCAGLVLGNIVGSAGLAATTSLLALYQPLLVGISIPVLFVSPLLVCKSLSKVHREGCIAPHKVE